ncbi:MAG: CBS domain-containing protein [Nitrosopumilaceae archaeon]
MDENQNSALNHTVTQKFQQMSVYSSPVITVDQEASIHDTLVQMQTSFIKRVVIADKNKPLGIVTERDISYFLEQDKTAKALNEIPIKYVMKKAPVIVPDGVDDKLEQCATRMETFKIGSVILVDDSGKLIGIVTKTDITKVFSKIYGGQYQVKDFMTRKLITCRKTDSLRFALNMINKNNISRLVVTDNKGTPVGIISTNDFLTHSDYFSDGKTRTRDYLLPLKSENLQVKDLLTDNLLFIEEGEDLARAASIMIKNKVSGIPVLDKNKNLVGLIDKSDIVNAFNNVKIDKDLSQKYGYLH